MADATACGTAGPVRALSVTAVTGLELEGAAWSGGRTGSAGKASSPPVKPPLLVPMPMPPAPPPPQSASLSNRPLAAFGSPPSIYPLPLGSASLLPAPSRSAAASLPGSAQPSRPYASAKSRIEASTLLTRASVPLAPSRTPAQLPSLYPPPLLPLSPPPVGPKPKVGRARDSAVVKSASQKTSPTPFTSTLLSRKKATISLERSAMGPISISGPTRTLSISSANDNTRGLNSSAMATCASGEAGVHCQARGEKRKWRIASCSVSRGSNSSGTSGDSARHTARMTVKSAAYHSSCRSPTSARSNSSSMAATKSRIAANAPITNATNLAIMPTIGEGNMAT
mmetsp:Transcript_21044/g.65206  ORF Transcript_21044/g.65206 Transcript_21044/m.65206 type:complete len:340 (+) Transcript_21044:158-1177(+)